MIQDEATFNVLVYTDSDAEIQGEDWIDSDPKYLEGDSEQVEFKSFSTLESRVGSAVEYCI